MFPAVGPPATEHITPRFEITGALRLWLRKFWVQHLSPHTLNEFWLALKRQHTILKQARFVDTDGIHTIEEAIYITLSNNTLYNSPINIAMPLLHNVTPV